MFNINKFDIKYKVKVIEIYDIPKKIIVPIWIKCVVIDEYGNIYGCSDSNIIVNNIYGYDDWDFSNINIYKIGTCEYNGDWTQSLVVV